MSSYPWPVHPAAEIFPLLEGEEYQAFRDDIKDRGLRHSVTLWVGPDGVTHLLDGRNRVRACQDLGLTPPTFLYEGDDPINEIVSDNVRRRHLSAGERGAIGARLVPLYLEQNEAQAQPRDAEGKFQTNRGNRSVPTDEDPQPARRANAQAARTIGGSQTAISQFRRIEKVDPETAERVAKGQITINQAYEAIRASHPALPRKCSRCGSFDHTKQFCSEDAPVASNGKPKTVRLSGEESLLATISGVAFSIAQFEAIRDLPDLSERSIAGWFKETKGLLRQGNRLIRMLKGETVRR